MNLPPALDKLHKMKYAMPIGAVMALLVDIALMGLVIIFDIAGYAYFGVFLSIIALTFFIFYVFGIRQLKWMIAFGMIIFLTLGAVITYFIVAEIYIEHDPVYSVDADGNQDGILTNGTVVPYYDVTPNKTFNFMVTYKGNILANNTEVRVIIVQRLYNNETIIKDMLAVDPLDNVTSDGKDYYYTTGLDVELYSYSFVVKYGNDWDYEGGGEDDDINTVEDWGPLTKEKGSVITALLPTGMIIQGICNLGMLFFIVVLLYWWLGRAKKQRKEWDSAREDAESAGKEPEAWKSDKKKAGEKKVGEEKAGEKKKKEADFTCTSCGGDAYDDDDACQSCGESFEDVVEEADEVKEDEKEADFTCTSCGADAYEDDKACRKCGESFDDDEEPVETPEEADEVPEGEKGQRKFCPHCGKDLEKQFYFCPHCGKPLEFHDDE